MIPELRVTLRGLQSRMVSNIRILEESAYLVFLGNSVLEPHLNHSDNHIIQNTTPNTGMLVFLGLASPNLHSGVV